MSLASCYKAKKMARGGSVKSRNQAKIDEKGVHQSIGGDGHSTVGHDVEESNRYKHANKGRISQQTSKNYMESAKDQHRKKLSELQELSTKDRTNLAEGGEVEPDPKPTPSPNAGEMTKSMRKAFNYAHGGECPSCGYSEGGMVANDTDVTADEMPSEFDDLVLRDDLEMSYDAGNSGDEEGNEALDHDDSDVVSSVMKSRKKKDKNPNPA